MGVENGFDVNLQNVELFDFSGMQIDINKSIKHNFDQVLLGS